MRHAQSNSLDLLRESLTKLRNIFFKFSFLILPEGSKVHPVNNDSFLELIKFSLDGALLNGIDDIRLYFIGANAKFGSNFLIGCTFNIAEESGYGFHLHLPQNFLTSNSLLLKCLHSIEIKFLKVALEQHLEHWEQLILLQRGVVEQCEGALGNYSWLDQSQHQLVCALAIGIFVIHFLQTSHNINRTQFSVHCMFLQISDQSQVNVEDFFFV